MTFRENGLFYDIIKTKDVTSEGVPIFRFAVWDSKGQMIDFGKLIDFSMEQVKERILELSKRRVVERRF